MNAIAVIQNQKPLVARFAERFGVDGDKLLHTLKATCFKTREPATNEQMMALLVVADQYRLNPFTREIFAFEDKHKGIVPVVSVDGWARIINEHAAYNGIEFRYSENITTMAGGKPCPEWCEAVIYRNDREHPIVVREYLDEVYQPVRNGFSGPWQTHTKRFLRHKTLIQGARIAFGFAGIYDEDEGQLIVSERTPNAVPTIAASLRDKVRARAAHIQELDAATSAGIATDAQAVTVTDWDAAAQSLQDSLTTAADRESLDDRASLITTLPEDRRAALYTLYDQRCVELAEEA